MVSSWTISTHWVIALYTGLGVGVIEIIERRDVHHKLAIIIAGCVRIIIVAINAIVWEGAKIL